MQKLQKKFSLKPFNTFGLDVKADYFFEFTQPGELLTFLRGNRQELDKAKLLVLGEGSNILFTGDFHGVVLHPAIKGYQMIDENARHVEIKAGAGEVWDDFVAYAVEQGWGGIENLSWIPGTVGAAPVQNLGAYGSEVKETIVRVEAMRISDYQPVVFTNEECGFTYRNSVFKQAYKDQYVILNVIFRLSKNPVFNLSYHALEKAMQQYNRLTLKNIREAVIALRKSKLPDPHEIGNAGSFFKNPLVSRKEALALQRQFPDIKTFHAGAGQVKIAAAWLIEQTGYKGINQHDAGTHKNQPLVLVNYGHADGQTLKHLAQEIQQQVYNQFGIYLEPEVRII